MTTSNSFTDRIRIAQKAELKVQGYLLYNGIEVDRVGQENWLPKWTHNKIKNIRDNHFLDMIRHFPDLTTGRALIQVKAAPSTEGYPTLYVQKSSFDSSRFLASFGIPVLMVFAYGKDGTLTGELQGNWVQNLTPKETKGSTQGSRSPAFEIDKKQLKPLSYFLSDL